jgi:hypothetical protein
MTCSSSARPAVPLRPRLSSGPTWRKRNRIEPSAFFCLQKFDFVSTKTNNGKQMSLVAFHYFPNQKLPYCSLFLSLSIKTESTARRIFGRFNEKFFPVPFFFSCSSVQFSEHEGKTACWDWGHFFQKVWRLHVAIFVVYYILLC